MDESAFIKSLVESRWNPGDTGKGLLVQVQRQPVELLTWRTLSASGPHHLDVVTALHLMIDDVVAFLGISDKGEVDLLTGDLSVMERVLALDPRLRAANKTWSFD
jgi:hypothetical protein